MLNSLTKWSVFFYSLLIIALGAVGYYQAESLPSLIAGVGCGILLLLSALLMFLGRKFGSYSALVLTILLTGIFSYRYTVTNALFPALLAVISGAMLIFLLAQLAKWKR